MWHWEEATKDELMTKLLAAMKTGEQQVLHRLAGNGIEGRERLVQIDNLGSAR